jgi:hypothetical protein
MFMGKFDDIIPLDEDDIKIYLDNLNFILDSNGKHPYSNLEIVLFKTIEKLQKEREVDKNALNLLKQIINN